MRKSKAIYGFFFGMCKVLNFFLQKKNSESNRGAFSMGKGGNDEKFGLSLRLKGQFKTK
jgi:hypothetical protein